MKNSIALSLFCLLLGASVGRGGYIDFDIQAQPIDFTHSSLKYDGGQRPLVGNVPVVSVTGQMSDVLSNVVLPLTNGRLTFKTGYYTGNDGGLGWTFNDEGSSITITGPVPGKPGNSPETLFQGQFLGDTHIITVNPNEFKVVAGGFSGRFSRDFETLYHIVPANLTYGGGLSILFNTENTPGQGFFASDHLNSGNVAIDLAHPVPEPSSLAVIAMGIGLGGFYAGRRRMGSRAQGTTTEDPDTEQEAIPQEEYGPGGTGNDDDDDDDEGDDQLPPDDDDCKDE